MLSIFQTNISEAKAIVFYNADSETTFAFDKVKNVNESNQNIENGFGITYKSESDLLDYRNLAKATSATAAKTGVSTIEQVALHGNSIKSLKPTWGYKLYSADGTFLKNGITSKLIPETRYTKAFMSDKYMVHFKLFPNRLEAYQWEFKQNQILRGPLNLNIH